MLPTQLLAQLCALEAEVRQWRDQSQPDSDQELLFTQALECLVAAGSYLRELESPPPRFRLLIGGLEDPDGDVPFG